MKKYFLGLSVFTIISFIIIGTIGANNRNKYGEDFLEYKKVMSKVDEGKELDKALNIINKMQEKEKRENYIFNIDRANVYIRKKEYKKAVEEYKKAMDNNIRFDTDNKFLINYAQTAFDAKNYELSKELIIKAQKLGLDEELNNKANEILSKIG